LTKDIQEHKRINDILFGPLERPALRWLAKNMPGWVTPDLLTAVGLLGSLIALAGYGLSSYDPLFLWLASVGFIIKLVWRQSGWTLARYRHNRKAHLRLLYRSLDGYRDRSPVLYRVGYFSICPVRSSSFWP